MTHPPNEIADTTPPSASGAGAPGTLEGRIPLRPGAPQTQWNASFQTLLVCLRIILGLIMLYASFPKFFNWENLSWATPVPPLDLAPFARSVYNYRALPVPLVNLAAMFIPAVEGICALCFLWGAWLRTTSLVLAFFQTAFLLGMIQAMMRGLDIDCGCFAGVDFKVGFLSIGRDSIFLVGFIAVFFLNQCQTQSEGCAPLESPDSQSG